MRSFGNNMFHQKNMEISSLKSFINSKGEGKIVCDLDSFESFSNNGNFIVEVRIELERSQHEDSKYATYDKSLKYVPSNHESGAPHSQLGSQHSNFPLAFTPQYPVMCHPHVPFHRYSPRFACSTLDRPKPNVQAQLRQNASNQNL